MERMMSYMNKNNLLAEGFFDKLFKKFNIKDEDTQKKIKKDKKLSNAVNNLNKATKDMESFLKDVTGNKKIKLQRFSALDFFL